MATTTAQQTDSARDHLVAFACRFNLSPAEAFVLPALFDRVAQTAKQSPAQTAAEATYSNARLGEYLASVARKVAAEVAA